MEKKNKNEYQTPENTVRLNKYIANAGICSRRKADEFIAKGQVKVNDEVVKEMGFRLKPTDVVLFKGKVVKPLQDYIYVLLNKPKNTITTTDDPKGRRTVMDIVRSKERIYPVGRLDRETTGLLLLTNDGDLAQKLAHPSYEVRKIYHAELDKNLKKPDLEKIKKGLELEDGPVQVDSVNYLQGKSKNEIGLEIHLGRNRIVRRIFEHLGYTVVRLDRVIYAGLTKKDLPRGYSRQLTKQEVIMLKHFI